MKQAIIVDLDGTLCNCEHRRHFVTGEKKDWRSFYESLTEDTLNSHIYGLMHRVGETQTVIIVSGRPDSYKLLTKDWLAKHGVYFDDIFMRKEGDNRKDAIVKKEIYEAHIKPHYNVTLVLDDRNQVVEMWRSLGLECWQVAEGNF